MSAAPSSIRQAWRNFLIEVAFAKDYKTPYEIESLGPLPNNPILDHLLPSLLVLKLASLVDEALSEHIAQAGLTIPKTYRADFNAKINLLRDGGYLKDPSKIHQLRELRNELAHESSRKATWKDLDTAIDTADNELQHLGFVGLRPQFEMCAERVPVEPSDPKFVMSFKYSVTLTSGGKKVAEFTWWKHVHQDGE